MKKLLSVAFLIGVLTSCGSADKRLREAEAYREATANYPESVLIEKVTVDRYHLALEKEQAEREKQRRKAVPDKAVEIIDYAMGFLGTKYRYGGTSKRGMDCSGLIYTSFINAADIFLPRTSRAMAKEGKRILEDEVRMGDLLFFETNPRRNRINHVGLVVEVEANHIQFIHATTHGGVMVSELDQRYWRNAFVEARRVLK